MDGNNIKGNNIWLSIFVKWKLGNDIGFMTETFGGHNMVMNVW